MMKCLIECQIFDVRRMPEIVADRMSDKLLDRMPDKMAEDISDRMPD